MTEKKLKRVLIMAGGTGGHVFPGLALAKYLQQQNVEVHWLGTEKGLEARLIPNASIPLHFITIQGLRGKGVRALLTAPFKIIKAILQARKIVQAINPDIVIGMGGFVSGPGGLAAWLLKKPLIIHEQNAKAGLTNKLLSPLAKKVLEAFPNTFNKPNVVYVGNPVRSEIENLPSPTNRLQRSKYPWRLLVLGGSLGAQALNEIVPKALSMLDTNDRPLVLHQTGEKHFDAAKTAYAAYQIDAKLVPFVDNMGEVYEWADLVICRAGALTVSELCAVGLGAIFVPFPYAVDDHQTANAQFMVDNGAAICLQQRGLTEERLAAIVREFSESPEKRIAFAEAARQLRNDRVVEKMFAICEEVCP